MSTRGGSANPQPVPLQQSLGAPAATAPAQQGTGIYSQFANPVTFMNSLFGNGAGGDGGFNFSFNGGGNQQQSAPQQQSPNFGTQSYSVASNPVAPGSFHSSGIGPGQAAAVGAWQNAQATNPTLQQTLGTGGQQNGGTPQGIADRVWGYLGQGAIQSSNPVSPGSWHSSGIGPAQAAAVGAWQNNQALNHIAQSMGYRGDQFAYRDADTSPQYIGGSLAAQNQYLARQGAQPATGTPAPAAGGAPAPAPATGGKDGVPAAGGGGGTANPATGGGEGIAPVYSTIDGNRGIYNDAQTQRNINQQVEESRTKGSMRSNMKKYSRPGMSMDAGTAAAAAPEVGSNYADALAAQASGGLSDQLLNTNYQLQGQDARGNETLALADLLRRLQATQNNTNNAMRGMILNPLGDMIGNLLSSV